MSSLRKLASGSLRLMKTTCHHLRQRLAVLSVTVVFICAPVYAMAWYLDVVGNIASSITITILVTALPVIQLMSQPQRLTKRSLPVWFSAFSLIAIALFAGDIYDWRFVSFSVFLVLLALPYGFVFWLILRHEWILSFGFALALAATTTYWIAGLTMHEEGYDLLLLPLLVILAGSVLWAPVASWTLKCARRLKDRRISGPGMQALAMTMLFFPVALVAIALPKDLGLSETWSNVSLALIGIFLSGVISEPLRCFLLEWGNLDPETNPSK